MTVNKGYVPQARAVLNNIGYFCNAFIFAWLKDSFTERGKSDLIQGKQLLDLLLNRGCYFYF